MHSKRYILFHRMLVDGNAREMVSITSAYNLLRQTLKHRTPWMDYCSINFPLDIRIWIRIDVYIIRTLVTGYGTGFRPNRSTTENEIHFPFWLRMLMAICLLSLPLCPFLRL